MYFQPAVDSQPRADGHVPPPGGATFASFVFFASLAALIAFAYAGGEWLGLPGGFGFPTDAAWVRAVFARSVLSGHGLTFASGARVSGVAAPSWILALGLAAAPTGGYILAAKLFGAVSVMLSAFLAWAITLRLLEDWRFAFLAGLLVVTSPLLAAQALSGTEGAFAGMLVLAVIYWQGIGWEGSRRQRVASTVALGLAALARPELFLLLPLVLVDRWLVSGIHGRPGGRLVAAFTRSVPEVLGAALIGLPYLLYNLRHGGPLWQQPDLVLRAQPVLAWPGTILSGLSQANQMGLWHSNPVALVAAALGFVVICLAPARARAEAPTFLPALTPVVLLLVPGLLWRYAGPTNALYSASYLVPLVSILAAGGLFLLYRVAQRVVPPGRTRAARWAFGVFVGLAVGALLGITWPQHNLAWNLHKEQVAKLHDLQVRLGEWAAEHLPADASIASREVGAIGFFSNRRVVDLGGSVSMEGIRALRRTKSPDADLLAYLEKTQPSHLAIRPAEFPNLSQRLDLLTEVIPFYHTDRMTNGLTTLKLYETPWPPPSVRAAAAQQPKPR